MCPFGIAGRADADVGALPDEADQIDRVGEAARRCFEGLFPLGRVAAQAEDVLDSQAQDFIEDARKRLGGGTHAGEMGHRLDGELAANAIDNAQRLAARAPAGAIG